MNSLIPYLLKVVLCSTLLYGYYWVALRNRAFHQWNRFYLLLIIPLSLLLPLLRFSIEPAAEKTEDIPLRLLQVVSDGNTYVEEVIPRGRVFDPSIALYSIYTVIALCLLWHFGRSLIGLYRLARRYPAQRIEEVDFIVAPVPGTPFSFFRRVFWNPAIDPASESGRQILQHELVHVREKHSIDKLLLQATLVLCWFNPVFWLIRNELHLVHEFIADEKSVRNQDAGTLASLILQAAYPQQYSRLTNPFFHRAIKRRLYMLNQVQKARVQYIGRVAALPLLAVIAFTFALRAQRPDLVAPVAGSNSEKFTVVIDAGHGRMENGAWNGASSNGIAEDELTLAIAKRIQALNADPNLNIVLTRATDAVVGLKERSGIAVRNNAQLFLSLHVDALQKDNLLPPGAPRGFSIFIPADSGAQRGSKLLGSVLQQSLNKVHPTDDGLRTRSQGIYVLKNSPCPAALIELGYINKDAHRAFLTREENQDKIAREILNAISRYRLRVPSLGVSTAPDVRQALDTLRPPADVIPVHAPADLVAPRPVQPAADVIQSIDVNGDRTITVTSATGKEETISYAEANRRGLLTPAMGNSTASYTSLNPPKALPTGAGTLVVLNGKRYEGITPLINDLLTRFPRTTVAGKSRINLFTSARIIEGADLRSKYGDRYERVLEITATESDLAGFAVMFWEQVKADESNAQHITLHSGDTLRMEQLRLIPLKSLLCPEGVELLSCRFSGDLKNGDIVEFAMRDGVLNERMKSIVYSAWPGQMLTVDDRIVKGPNGETKKLPAIVYFVR